MTVPFKSTKTYGHAVGLSACFRQWRADSHCNTLHGYALSFRFVFGAYALDERNWVVDFGALKPLKVALEKMFDHITVVAEDDPRREVFEQMHAAGVANIMFVPAVGCEAFAQMAYRAAEAVISDYNRAEVLRLGNSPYSKRVSVLSCECSEHGANSAIYQPRDY